MEWARRRGCALTIALGWLLHTVSPQLTQTPIRAPSWRLSRGRQLTFLRTRSAAVSRITGTTPTVQRPRHPCARSRRSLDHRTCAPCRWLRGLTRSPFARTSSRSSVAVLRCSREEPRARPDREHHRLLLTHQEACAPTPAVRLVQRTIVLHHSPSFVVGAGGRSNTRQAQPSPVQLRHSSISQRLITRRPSLWVRHP
jgi:hypothetical protein